MKIVAGKKKKARNFGPPPFGPPPFGTHPSGPPPFGAPPFVVHKFNIQKLAEVEIGRSRNWPKSKLAEFDRARESLARCPSSYRLV